jgi:hypothetical protein
MAIQHKILILLALPDEIQNNLQYYKFLLVLENFKLELLFLNLKFV